MTAILLGIVMHRSNKKTRCIAGYVAKKKFIFVLQPRKKNIFHAYDSKKKYQGYILYFAGYIYSGANVSVDGTLDL